MWELRHFLDQPYANDADLSRIAIDRIRHLEAENKRLSEELDKIKSGKIFKEYESMQRYIKDMQRDLDLYAAHFKNPTDIGMK